MAVLTAVVVIIAVATLLPRDSTVMRALGLGATATARDDSFRLIAAGQATLDVMANDTGVDPARGDRLEVMAQPACGRVTPVGTKLRLEGFEACTGADSFRYCLRRDGACSTATVTLVIDGPDPVARVAPVARSPGPRKRPRSLRPPW